MAPVFYMYGAALLCKAQEEQDVFGGQAAAASDARDAKAAPPPPPADRKGKGKAAAAPAPAAGEEKEEEGEEEGEEGEGDDNEDPSDLQLAWENLDTARLLYSAANGRGDHSEALGQVYVKLGQVLLEEEQFEGALGDFNEALRLFSALSPVPHRRIAGLLHDAALALQQLGRPADALSRFGEAIAACRRRLDELRAVSSVGQVSSEAAEIAATIEDMRAREEELRVGAAEEARTKAALKNAMASLAGAATAGAGGGFDAPRLGGGAGGAAAKPTELGVIGRGAGITRVTPVPAAGGAAAGGAAAGGAAAAAAAAAPNKRPMEGGKDEGGAKAAKPAGDAGGDCKTQ